ncbi:hypothetical protein [Parafrankia sp. EUN1f]|uniref:hypothetical protein n=1 Tax=Parafrankia sp. EUN1f TaxID=102897 RepID=UPI0001C44AC8|nr:hypothetical protein [Parafrankia sp. EUN1f]EFC83778.1 hypothetical protein FrEUN1fDRAFT_3138 [Parafrankia sp. EUN1f]
MTGDPRQEGVGKSPGNPSAGGNDSPQQSSSPQPDGSPRPSSGRSPSGAARDDVRAARATQGETQARLSTEREHRATVQAGRDFLGPGYAAAPTNYNFFGHEYTHRSAAGVRSRPLSAEELAQAEVFVEPPGFSALADAITRSHLVVMRGPAGTGKTASAVRLLQVARVEKLFELAPDTDLRQFVTEHPEEGAGYLLSNISQSQANALGQFDLSAVTSQLAGRRAFLVVTMADSVRLADMHTATALTELTGRPDQTEVLTGHLARRLAKHPGVSRDGARARARHLLTRGPVRAFVAETLSAQARMEEIVTVAWTLADVAAGSETGGAVTTGDLVKAARAKVAARDHAAFADWFRGLPPGVESRTLAIALAVLQGEPYETIADAALSLEHRLARAGNAGLALAPGQLVVPPAQPDWFGRDRTSRLARMRARVTATTVEAHRGGTSPAGIAQFDDVRYPGWVLLHTWHEYDLLRPELLAWLRYLGGHPTESVRVRAAVTAGTLAALAFDIVCAQVIIPWASSDLPWEHDAAAIALHEPAVDPDLAAAVEGLVYSWEYDDDPQLRSTAARAFGASLGARDPAEALRRLETLADTETFEVTNAICISVVELLLQNEDQIDARVLEHLCRWADRREPLIAMTGRLAFLVAAVNLIDRVPSQANPGKTLVWPLLLRIAVTDPARSREVVYLWEKAFNSDFSEATYYALEIWAIMLDLLPNAQRALAELVVNRPQLTHTLRCVAHAAQSWLAADPEPLAPNTARTVLQYLASRRGS